MSRITKRFNGWRKIKNLDLGFIKTKDLYAYDPITPKLKLFIKKEYKWLITTIIALLALIFAIILK
jgi:hypothetical protein